MRVFRTGATGFTGSRIVPELLDAGYGVFGLTRSDDGAQRLERSGAQVYRGMLEDVHSVAAGAVQADAVIHTAFDHECARFVENRAKDARIAAITCDRLDWTPHGADLRNMDYGTVAPHITTSSLSNI